MNKEIRNINLQDIDIETTENECILRGYVNKYNARSQNLGGFYEEIRQGAFDESLTKNDILALYGHDYNKPLGRLGNNLELKSDDIGLYFELRINTKVSWAKDTFELVKDGVLNGMSFGFCCEDDEWTDDNGKNVRNINKLDLFEISIVSSPAYLDSTVSCRSYEQYKNDLDLHKQNEIRNLEMELIKLELDVLQKN